MQQIFPKSVALFPIPLPLHEGYGLIDRLKAYVDDSFDLIEQMQELELSGVIIACTGSSYPLGYAGDARWTSELSTRLGVPVVTATGAVQKALVEIKASTLRLISPYPEQLTEQCVQFWSSLGYHVTLEPTLDRTQMIYDVSAESVRNALDRSLSLCEVSETVLIAGTGVSTLKPLDQIARPLAHSVITSQLATSWAMLDVLGQSDLLRHSPNRATRFFSSRMNASSHG